MGLIGGMAWTAVVAGTATAVSNRVSRRQANRWAAQEQQQMEHQYYEQQQYQQPYQQPAQQPGGGNSPGGGNNSQPQQQQPQQQQPQQQPVAPAPDPANAAPPPVVGQAPPAQHVAAPAEPRPAAPVPQSPVRLAELGQAAQTAIRVTAREGGASARIVLRPEELGTVEIKLTYGADGITAAVRADSPQAAQTLLQAGGDLRRALEAQGMPLLDLDIRERARDEVPQEAPRRGRRDGGFDDDGDEQSIAVDPTRLVAAGSQIDVFA